MTHVPSNDSFNVPVGIVFRTKYQHLDTYCVSRTEEQLRGIAYHVQTMRYAVWVVDSEKSSKNITVAAQEDSNGRTFRTEWVKHNVQINTGTQYYTPCAELSVSRDMPDIIYLLDAPLATYWTTATYLGMFIEILRW